MKIAFICDWYPTRLQPFNGNFVQRHAKAAALNHEICVLVVKGEGDSEQEIYQTVTRKEGSLTEHYVYFKKSSFKIVNLYRYYKSWSLAFKFYESLYGTPDLIHANNLPRGGFIGRWASHRWRRNFIISEHWSGFLGSEFDKLPFFRRLMMTISVKKASCILPVSLAQQKGMERRFSNRNYQVLQNVVELPARIEASALNSDKIKFITVGTWDYWKNVSGLIRGFQEAFLNYPNIELHIVGDNPGNPELINLANSFGLLNKAVFFHGQLAHEEVLSMMKSCQAFICNSRLESFSVVCAESLACGVPVITTRCGGPEEFIGDEFGIQISVEDHNALVDAISTMITQYQFYDKNKLIEHAQKLFGMESIAKAIDHIYHQYQ